MRTFELTEDQEEKLKVWQEKIKDLFGNYGEYEFRFRSNGIGTECDVHSDLTGTILNLTDISKW